MRNRIDYILLGLLWLLAATLATSFWFNTAFGFNIFSAQHWQYLGYMQASNQVVKPMFYISLIIAIFATIGGMYLLLRPRLRRIRLPIRGRDPKSKKTDTPKHNPQPMPVAEKAPVVNNDESTINIITAPAAPAPAPQHPVSPTPKRPPRLVLPPVEMRQPPRTTVPSSATPFVNVAAPDPKKYFSEIRQIFESAGYVSKGNPKIGAIKMAAFAIGANEVLWMGAIGVSTTDMRSAIDRIAQVFSDTLDDIIINVNGFVIDAPDAATSEFQDILMFDSIDALREYMSGHPNPPIQSDEQGNFDAYSAYISTVAEYIEKI